jgi:hypothetical protein
MILNQVATAAHILLMVKLLNKIQNITIDMYNVRMNCNEFKILFTDCIHTKTMSHLLKLY